MFGGIKGTFNPDKDIGDLAGKVIIVTGGNSGVGLETVHQLAKHNPQRIYLGARDASKAALAIESLKTKMPADAHAKITPLIFDLGSFESVRAGAADFLGKEARLDVLINNAGIMTPPPATTAEGYEIQFGTNHMGHAVLTRLLTPVLQQTAAQHGGDVRVVTVGSGAERWAPKDRGILFDEIKGTMTGLSGFERYGQSKLANVVYTRSLARLVPAVLAVTVHPGGVRSNISQGAKASYPMLTSAISVIHHVTTVPASKGAWNSLWAATAPRSLLKPGAFYHPVMREVSGTKMVQSKDLEERLWAYTEGEFKSHGLPTLEELGREQAAQPAETAAAVDTAADVETTPAAPETTAAAQTTAAA